MSRPNRTIPPPWPASLDREAFGHYLSGLTDGEGHFNLSYRMFRTKLHPDPYWGTSPHFRIALRADDREVLDLAHAFFSCGLVGRRNRAAYDLRHPNDCPQYYFGVSKVSDLARVVIPHFERYPLRAKKRHDFALWRQGIDLAYHVHQRRVQRRCGTRGGALSKWTSAEREQFVALADALKQQRCYQAPALVLPPPVKLSAPTLFPLE